MVREINFIGSMRYGNVFGEAIRLVAEGRIALRGLITESCRWPKHRKPCAWPPKRTPPSKCSWRSGNPNTSATRMPLAIAGRSNTEKNL